MIGSVESLDFLSKSGRRESERADTNLSLCSSTVLFDESVREFIERNNPWVQRDLSERLLEANQRGLWEDVDLGMLDRLRVMVNEAEGVIESQGN